MPNDFYNSAQDVAETLISRFGRTITLQKTKHNQWTPGAIPQPRVLIIQAVAAFREKKARLRDGKEYVSKEANFLVAAKNLPLDEDGEEFLIDPLDTHIIDTDGVKFKVVQVNKLKPGNIAIYYEVFVEKLRG